MADLNSLIQQRKILRKYQGQTNTNIVEELINYGANVNMKDKKGYTPLYSASFAGNNDTCIYLIMNGANIEEENEKCTPLRGACIGGHKDTALLLINHGACRLMLLNLL